MSYRILTKNAVENTNIDGARDHNFNAGRRSGIVQGALNSGNLFLSANNTIALDTCELRLCGHRVVIDSAEYKTFYNQPSVPIRYSLVAQIIVSNNGESVSFDLKTQLSTTPLVQNDLDKNINGTYELEIGRFTQLTDGTLTDVVRTADLITGGAGGGDSDYIRIGTVTTNKISPELDADVDIENTINPTDNKPQTNFTFNLPTAVGTVVSVNGEEKTAINTDTTPTANSENLITSGGVHDYPAIVFAESERQKSKNLFKPNFWNKSNNIYQVNGITFTYNPDDYSITINGTATARALCYLNPDALSNIKTGTYAFSGFSKKTDYSVYIQAFNEADGKYPALLYSDSDFRTVTFNIMPNFTDLYIAVDAGIVVDNLVLKLQAEEGSVATDYQPYNGEFIQEKEFHETAIVRYGINLSDIANSYQSTWDELIKGNGFGNFYTSGVTFPSFLPACPDDIWHEAGNIVEIGVKIKSNNFTSSMEFVLQGVNQNNPAYKLDAYFDGTNWRNSGWYKPRAIELIYDKEIKNTIDGTAYTNGLYTSGLYIKNNIPNDVTRLRIYYVNQKVSIIDHGGTKNICELDISDRNTEWCETCVVNAHKSDSDAVDDTLFKLLLAVDTAGYMNVKFFKNTTKIEDGTSYVYRIEGVK